MLLADMPPRFQAKVAVRDNGCWEWTAYCNPKGYGILGGTGHSTLAYKYAWELTNGPVPPGLVLDHFLHPVTCCGPACANPTHVRPVTHRENTLRSDFSLAASYTAADFCAAGHPLTPENTGWYPSRGRFCRACGPAVSRIRRK